MRASWVLIFLGLGCACGDPAPSEPAAAEAELATALPSTVLTRGTMSAISTQRLAVARDGAAWWALWSEHSANLFPPPPPPKVDFSASMVVAVFLGQRTSGGYEVAIDECVLDGERLLVRAHETRPDKDALVTAALTAPYEFVLVPPTPGTASLELRP